MTNFPYIAIIGDIRHSRSLKERSDFQQHFSRVLAEINRLYAADLAAPFTITMGDAFQGLLQRKQHLLTILWQIESQLTPVEVRMGVGFGAVNTQIHPENSLLNDGSSYHRARNMIDQIETSEKQYMKNKSNILLSTGENLPEYEQLINTIFSLQTSIKRKWTQRQKEIIQEYCHQQNQYQTARALGISQSSVNKALNNADFYTFEHSLVSLQKVVDRL